MPDEPTGKRNPDLQLLLKVFIDMMVHTTALQQALVEQGVLTWDQISDQFDRLNQSPEVAAFRAACEAEDGGIERLLKSFRGPVN